jgi:hypothetical protein
MIQVQATAFTGDGTFIGFSVGVTWRGPGELPEQVGELRAGVPWHVPGGTVEH